MQIVSYTNWIIKLLFFFISAFFFVRHQCVNFMVERINDARCYRRTTTKITPTTQRAIAHSPMRMMSGRQLTEHRKIAIKNKWAKIGEASTIFAHSLVRRGCFLTEFDKHKMIDTKFYIWENFSFDLASLNEIGFSRISFERSWMKWLLLVTSMDGCVRLSLLCAAELLMWKGRDGRCLCEFEAWMLCTVHMRMVELSLHTYTQLNVKHPNVQSITRCFYLRIPRKRTTSWCRVRQRDYLPLCVFEGEMAREAAVIKQKKKQLLSVSCKQQSYRWTMKTWCCAQHICADWSYHHHSVSESQCCVCHCVGVDLFFCF